MKLFAVKKANNEARRDDVNALKGTFSSVIGLKLHGSVVSPFLCMRTVHAVFYTVGILPDCQMIRNNPAIYERR